MDSISISIPRALLLLFLLLSSSLHWTAARCLPSQSSALLQLKRGFSFDFPATSNLSSWLRGSDCCNGWEGVACGDPASSSMVTALHLGGLQILGKIDPSLFNLTALVSLDLSYNYFGPAPIPSSFDRLLQLTYLNLSHAHFTGQIPIGISRLTNLVSLDLSSLYNQYFFLGNSTLEDPSFSLLLRNPDLGELIRNLSSLRELFLDGVNISADGIEWCRVVSESAPGLQKLSMVHCSLSGPIDASLSGLSSLTVIRLDQNNLNSDVPKFFGNFSSLVELSLSECGLTGSLPDSISRLKNLTILDVYDNQFTGRIPASIGNLSRLTNLDLSVNNFSGEIPSDVSWGAGISYINLAQNNLNGSIPTSFGDKRLHNLVQLDLANNLLSGSIPVSLFSLPALQTLLLSQNQLSGSLGEFLNASPMLSFVDLSENLLQGGIPLSIFNLSRLGVLELGSNNFSGTLQLDLFGSLTSLSYLDLSNNRLSIQYGENSSLSLPKFGALKLAGCNLIKFPNFLRHQRSMQVVDLSNNKIGGAIPQWIWNMSLSYLNLSHNLFTDVEGPLPEPSMRSRPITIDFHYNRLQGPILLPPIYNIGELDYSNNNFSSSIPPNISSYLNFTTFFSLSNNNLSGGVPSSICQGIYLQVLDLSDNHLNGSIPTCLMGESFKNLTVLNLRGNQLHGTIPYNISDQCALQNINLNSNQIEGKVPRSLNNCKMLEVLDIGNNYMVDTFPFWLSNLSKLKVLVLKSNGFYGPIGRHLANNAGYDIFPILQIFDISSNYFNGSLPSEYFTHLRAMMVDNMDTSSANLGLRSYQNNYMNSINFYQDIVTVIFKGIETTLVKTLTIFTSIDFSNNRFEGIIPETIGGLRSLLMLNLSHNSFMGPIPQSLAGLGQLESMDLSSNRLSGEIPPQLTTLTFLAFLNLSYNHLSGRIPHEAQFSTFDSSAFDGNEGLCGMPLPKPCSIITTPTLGGEPHDGKKTNIIVLAIFIGSGFGVGLGMTILFVLILQRKRVHRRVPINLFQ